MKLLLLKLRHMDVADVLSIIALICITISICLAFTLGCFLYHDKFQAL